MGLLWKKSTASGSGNCVEFAADGDLCLVRDSTLTDSPILTFPAAQWDAVLRDLRDGRLG